ncbi:MAG: DUF5985 family protein [Bdellovibrionales bacterium]
MTKLVVFLSGVNMAAFCASGLFFLKFWRASHDRLFVFFAAACWLLAAEKVVWMILSDPVITADTRTPEFHISVYLLRLAAFTMIMMAIVQKNMKTKAR